MRFNLVPVIYRKEMLDTVRDRRTLISMVVAPIVAMPLLFFVIGHFMSSAERRAGEEAVSIAVRSGEALPGLLDWLKESGFRLASPKDVQMAMDNKQIAAWLEPAVAAGGVTEVRIYADETRQASELAARKIQTALENLKQEKITTRLHSLGVPETVLKPFTVKRINVAQEKKMAGFFWGSLIGYIVVLLMFSAGMYPAIDMTAGEKERRTLEIFLSTPAGRNEIVLGKILATTSAVFVTALLSISSLLVSFRYSDFGQSSRRMKETMGRIPLDAQTLVLVILALVPLAIMAASLMIAIALLAKSFKEAQSYLTPLVLAVVFPLVVGMLPGIQLTPLLALAPLFNVCQLIKEIFTGEFSWVAFGVTMLANLVYAGVAFLAATRVFKDERVLFRT